MKSNLVKEFELAEKDLGLKIISPYTLHLSHNKINAELLLKDFGGENGILIITDYETVEPHQEELNRLGYGYSTLSEPAIVSYDRQDFIEMLTDWGWTGDLDNKPNWIMKK